MADILTVTEYPSVRAVIDMALDASTLPDTTIGLDVYAGATDRYIKQQVADWSTILAGVDADLIANLRNAGVYYCASLIAGSSTVVTSMAVGEARWARSAYDREKHAKWLLGQAQSLIADVIGTATPKPKPIPTVFAVGSKAWTE